MKDLNILLYVSILLSGILLGQDNLLSILITFVSSFCRAFLDTIEKYLFSIDFIDIFKLIIFEGIIDLIFASCLFILEEPQNQLNKLINNDSIYLVIGLLIIYGILSGFKNIYRRYTVKEFTPMTRALAESILDPFLIIYGFIQNDFNKKEDFIITLICSIIMVFCSCVYNEIFVLYCCGLENNTHLGVVDKKCELELSYNSSIKSDISAL